MIGIGRLIYRTWIYDSGDVVFDWLCVIGDIALTAIMMLCFSLLN